MCPAVKAQRLPHFLIPLDDAVYNISPELAKTFAMKSSWRALSADPRQPEEKEKCQLGFLNIQCTAV